MQRHHQEQPKLLEEMQSLVLKYKQSCRDPDQPDVDRQIYAREALQAVDNYLASGGKDPKAFKDAAYFKFCFGPKTDEARQHVHELLHIASEAGDKQAEAMISSLTKSGGRYICNGVNYIETIDHQQEVPKKSKRSWSEVETEYCRRRLGMDLR